MYTRILTIFLKGSKLISYSFKMQEFSNTVLITLLSSLLVIILVFIFVFLLSPLEQPRTFSD